MKKILLLIMVLAMHLSVEAQLKVIEEGNAISNAEMEIIPPVSKRNTGNLNRPSSTFQPRTLEFVVNLENGLNVEKRSIDKQLPIFIKGKPTLNLFSGGSPEARSMNFLENAKGLMKVQNPSEEFKVIETKTDELGFTHVKMRQEIHGIPIYGSEIIVHITDEESFMNGRYVATPELESYTAQFDKKEAEALTVNDLGGLSPMATDKLGIFDVERIESELVIYEERLTHHLTVYKSWVDRWEYFVDATTGEIIHKHSSMCKFHNHDSAGSTCNHAHHSTGEAKELDFLGVMPPPPGPVISSAVDLFGATRQINTYEVNGTYYMIDASRTMYDDVNSNIPDDPIGTIWTIDAFNTSPENSNFQFDHVSSGGIEFDGKPTAVSAQYNGGQAYLYFKNVHDRESINGNGGNVIGLINIADEDGSSLGNAFWNGVAMFYGNGDSSFDPLAKGLDVAGHEMSHGVIQSTANLEYQGESGALNESFADIFGAMIDRDDWVIGEDVVKMSAFPSGALRSLEDPHNGAQTGDFNKGWQPKLYSERFTGSEDNGGVHINSGIPNHAFYLFATSSDVGRARAEKVYYRALDVYLTKSSKFIDARLAVVQAAQDLYGTNVANKAKDAFDAVEIFDGNGTNNQTDVEVNPGEDLILFTTENQNGLYIANSAGQLIFDPLTNQNPISVPSITDDGTEIVFVNEDKKLYYIKLDWATESIVEEGVLGFTNEYRNVVFSRDGLRMAVLRDNLENEIFVFDWVSLEGTDYELFNPTFTEGVSTGDVLYADAMQFDFSGEYLMYDAFNRIQSTSGSEIDYWDIGFIKVFNNDAGTFTLGSDVQKLFSQLPEGVSIGNPTFSKNSDYIIAFDYLEDNTFSLLGTNTETGDIGEIYFNNDQAGYPSYSNHDDVLIFNGTNTGGTAVVAGAQLEDNKIQSSQAAVQLGFDNVGVKWGVWFGNGDRVISSNENILPEAAFDLLPNPASTYLQIASTSIGEEASIKITDMMGRIVYSEQYRLNEKIDISALPQGQYVLSVIYEGTQGSKMFVKH